MRRLLLLLALLCARPAFAGLSAAALGEAGVSPPAGARLPFGAYVDQTGKAATLAPSAMPILLLFADFTCAHLCGPGLTLTAGGLHDAGLVPGRDYRLVVIGLDQDGPAAARHLLATRLATLPAEAHAAQVLTGSPATIARSEAALGYKAVYDRALDQFAHSAAIYVFAPDGHLARLLPETAATADALKQAVTAARDEKTLAPSGLVDRIVTLCYGLDAAHGVYGRAIVFTLRLAGVATLLAIGFGLWRLHRGTRPA